jgi:hypothetical protein
MPPARLAESWRMRRSPPSLNQWIPANHLKKGEKLKTANGTLATADGGSVPSVHVGWMWDLTIPGNGDHDFYVIAGNASVLVHNSNCGPGFAVSSDGTVTNLADPSATRVGVPKLDGGTLQQVGAKI